MAERTEKMAPSSLALIPLTEILAICRLEPEASIPDWALRSSFFSITRTPDELSLVVAQRQVSEGIRCEGGWRALKVKGPLDFALTGILVSLCAPLAEVGISVFALSTYDTDYLLVREAQWDKALAALQAEGHTIHDEPI
jgi:hypothetical protein